MCHKKFDPKITLANTLSIRIKQMILNLLACDLHPTLLSPACRENCNPEWGENAISKILWSYSFAYFLSQNTFMWLVVKPMPLLAFNSSRCGEEARVLLRVWVQKKELFPTPFQPVLPPPLCTAHHIWFISEVAILDEHPLVVLSCNVNCVRAAVHLSSPCRCSEHVWCDMEMA